MTPITDITALEALYDVPSPRSLTKVVRRITPHYATWINRSRFCVLTTVGPEGTDGSPRGDVGPVARLVDDKTLHLPDWRGNNRMDSLRNIVRDGRVSLMFMMPGSTSVVRVNGAAVLRADAAITESFEHNGKHPRSVIVITVNEAYFQCAKALMRSELWTSEPADDLPTAGQFLMEQEAEFDGKTYDENYVEYAKPKLW